MFHGLWNTFEYDLTLCTFQSCLITICFKMIRSRTSTKLTFSINSIIFFRIIAKSESLELWRIIDSMIIFSNLSMKTNLLFQLGIFVMYHIHYTISHSTFNISNSYIIFWLNLYWLRWVLRLMYQKKKASFVCLFP